MKKTDLIVPMLLFVSLLMLFIRWIPDDAFISFTYAKHWAEGMGPVFVAGERVEGFSNLLWTAYLAAAGRIGFDIVGAAVATSLLASIVAQGLIFALLFRAGRLFGGGFPAGGRRSCIALMAASSCFFPFVFYATSGLESAAYLLFLLLGAYLQIGGMIGKHPFHHAPAAWSFLAAALLRPEGVLFLAGSICFAVAAARPRSRRTIAGMIIPLVLFLGVAAAKARYYGDFLPNTYYAKPGCSFGYLAPFAEGTYYVLRFFIKSAFLALLPFALVPPGDRRKLRVWLYLWFLICVQLFFIVYVGVDVLRFDRFMLPLFPFYFALALSGMIELLSTRSLPLRRALSRLAILSCILVILSNASQMAMARSKPCIHDWMHGGSLRNLGLLLKSALPPGCTVATNEVGAIAYCSGFDVIDMLGLTDKTVSRIRYASFLREGIGSSPESVARVRDYILSRNPEAVILPSYIGLTGTEDEIGDDVMHPLWAAFLESARFRDGYARVLSIAVNERKHLNVYVRRGVAFAPPDSASPFVHRCGRIEWLR